MNAMLHGRRLVVIPSMVMCFLALSSGCGRLGLWASEHDSGAAVGDAMGDTPDAETIDPRDGDAEAGRCSVGEPGCDSDDDGVLDELDPLPLDPHPGFLIVPDKDGAIHLVESNRDGTFAPNLLMVEPFGVTYGALSVADVDGDGLVEVLAHTEAEGSTPWTLWLFDRGVQESVFSRRSLGEVERQIAGTIADVDDDGRLDIVALHLEIGERITSAFVYSYLGVGDPSAACAVGSQCLFGEPMETDLTEIAFDESVLVIAKDAFDLDDDGHVDLLASTHAGGGNAASTIWLVSGRGDGAYDSPRELFVHNEGGDMSAANSIVLADVNLDGRPDIIAGFDDDGDAGAGWLYVGLGGASFDLTPREIVDVNPAAEASGDAAGGTSSAQSYDFNVDGIPDLVLGHEDPDASGLSVVSLFLGQGEGTFGTVTRVGPALEEGFTHEVRAPTPWPR